MGNNKKVNFILIIDVPVQPVKKLYTFLSDIIKLLEKKRPFSSGNIHWALSSTMFAELSQKAGSSIRDLLKKRIISHNDSIIPKGFSGSSHSLLLQDELEKEINWGLSNPWSTGIKDLFDIYPDAWLPSDIDLVRSSLRFLYDSYPYIWIVWPSSEPGETTVQCLYKTDLIEFSLFHLNGTDDVALYKKIKKNALKRNRPIFLHLNLTGPESHSSLKQFFSAAEKMYGSRWTVSFSCLDTHLLERQERGTHDGSGVVVKEVLPHSPVHRLTRMMGYRNHTTGSESAQDEKTASFLHDFGKTCSTRFPEIPETSDAPFLIKERSLFSNMPGLAVISEQNQTVQFENGRLQEISFRHSPITCGLPVESYISMKEETWLFQPTTVFTFEDKASRGLRESLIVEATGKDAFLTEGGYLIVDYYFIEEIQDLAVSVHVRFPEFPREMVISSFAPLEIPLFLFERSEKILIRGWYPDGGSYSIEAPGEEGVYEFSGSVFCISYGRFHLWVNFSCAPNNPVSLLPARVKKKKKQFLFSINPMGSYRACSSAYLGGIGEYFTFLLKGFEGALPPGDITKYADKEIFDPPRIVKDKPLRNNKFP